MAIRILLLTHRWRRRSEFDEEVFDDHGRVHILDEVKEWFDDCIHHRLHSHLMSCHGRRCATIILHRYGLLWPDSTCQMNSTLGSPRSSTKFSSAASSCARMGCQGTIKA
jgi:hypothetical protein